MIITSYLFMLGFLPISYIVYWRICRNPSAKLWLLCILNYVFYSFAGLHFVPLLLGLSTITFYLARWGRIRPGIVLNLIALGYFKYWNFGATNVNALGAALGLPAFVPLINVALPLGISFYVFKHVGYLLDVQQKKYPATDDWLDFATFSALFFQISAGPLSNFPDTGNQLRSLRNSPDAKATYEGLVYLSAGLAKKLLIADVLGASLQANLNAQNIQLHGMIFSWITVGIYALQLYFDFSGYTDIVIGVALLFNVRLPENFNNPYLATDPSQFWQRWHVSVSTWFRVYIFSPLSRALLRRWGGNRSEQAQYAANMLTMLLIGLWHGAGWGFVLWGAYHGILLNVHAWTRRRQLRVNSRRLAQCLLLLAILIGWAFFVSPDLKFAAHFLGGLFGINGIGSLLVIPTIYSSHTLFVVAIAVLLTLSGRVESANLPRLRHPAYGFVLGVLAVVSLLHLASALNFVYVQF